METRIVTRPDFDGVVCAVLLKEALDITSAIQWVQPNDIQNGVFPVQRSDVLANLPYNRNCSLWFDHHVSNAIQSPFDGLFRIAPSAAGLIYEYYSERISTDFSELIEQTDKIDSARLSMDEILHPEKYPYVIISMATSFDPSSHIPFCNHLVDLLGHYPIDAVLADDTVARRCRQVRTANSEYKTHLKKHTAVREGVSITDFRGMEKAPEGNRFLVYSLFPDAFVNIKLYYEGSKIGVKVGHSIVNPSCRVNVGRLMAGYGGGGHRGAGACRLDAASAPDQLEEIIRALIANHPGNPADDEPAFSARRCQAPPCR